MEDARVLADIASFRALFDAQTAARVRMTDADMDRAAMMAQVEVMQSVTASASDKAKAGVTFAALRKALKQSEKSDDTPKDGALQGFIDSLQEPE